MPRLGSLPLKKSLPLRRRKEARLAQENAWFKLVLFSFLFVSLAGAFLFSLFLLRLPIVFFALLFLFVSLFWFVGLLFVMFVYTSA